MGGWQVPRVRLKCPDFHHLKSELSSLSTPKDVYPFIYSFLRFLYKQFVWDLYVSINHFLFCYNELSGKLMTFSGIVVVVLLEAFWSIERMNLAIGCGPTWNEISYKFQTSTNKVATKFYRQKELIWKTTLYFKKIGAKSVFGDVRWGAGQVQLWLRIN